MTATQKAHAYGYRNYGIKWVLMTVKERNRIVKGYVAGARGRK